jgi:general secretion pathway protein I
MHARRSQRGFTLLEVMIAMAILALALVALSDINAGAIAMHSYAKKLTVATFLAKSKMLDIESQLDADGLPAEGDNISPSDGNFDDQGFPSYTWKVEVVAPKSDNLDPMKLVNLVTGGGGSPTDSLASNGSGADPSAGGGGLGSLLGGAGGGLLGMLMGGSSPSSSSSSSSSAPSGPTSTGMSGMASMAGSAMAMPAQMMMTQITQMVREVHLTVSWMDGKTPQEFTVIEHLVSMGPNTPLGGTGNNGTKNTGGQGTTNVPGALPQSQGGPAGVLGATGSAAVSQ